MEIFTVPKSVLDKIIKEKEDLEKENNKLKN
jgi:hypothetical protein